MLRLLSAAREAQVIIQAAKMQHFGPTLVQCPCCKSHFPIYMGVPLPGPSAPRDLCTLATPPSPRAPGLLTPSTLVASAAVPFAHELGVHAAVGDDGDAAAAAGADGDAAAATGADGDAAAAAGAARDAAAGIGIRTVD